MIAAFQLETSNVVALGDLGEKLQRYQQLTGKTAVAVLLQKGAQLLFGNADSRYGRVFPGLVDRFRVLAPAPGAIWAAARTRHFRLGRKIYGGQLSPHALEKAQEMMGGNKSVVISSRPDGTGLSFLRFGRSGRRVHFRRGRLSFAVSGDFAGPLPQGEKRIGFRAVATFFELQFRERGRQFLSSAWLINRWRRLAQSDPLRQELQTWRVLKNNNPRSRLGLLGEAELGGDEGKANVQLRITSFVPGTMTIGTARNVFEGVIADLRSDIATYLAKKAEEAWFTQL